MARRPTFHGQGARRQGRRINICIACNQACLDYIFSSRAATCLVIPITGRELDFDASRRPPKKRIAVVGAGPAGLACATTAAERGHDMTLYQAAPRIGGQLNIARNIPGKEEFDETVRYFGRIIETRGVALKVERARGERPGPQVRRDRRRDRRRRARPHSRRRRSALRLLIDS